MANEQKKAAALAALMTHDTLTEAADAAGIDRRTLYSYLHNDLTFARTYFELRCRQAVVLMDSLTERKAQAIDVVTNIMTDESQPAAIRLQAARTILMTAADHEKLVSDIACENVTANKDIFDLSTR